MKLTKSEMNLENLESSAAYDGAMIGELLLFQANTNIPHEQSVPLIQKVVHRCNSQPDLFTELKMIIALLCYPGSFVSVEDIDRAKAVIAKAKQL